MAFVANETRGGKTANEIFNQVKDTVTCPVEPIREGKVLYLVRRYFDGLGPGDWGGDDDPEGLEADSQRFLERNAVSLPYQKIDIMEIDLDKTYGPNDEPLLGGGAYVE